MLREAGGGLKAIAGNRVQTDYHSIHTGFCPFLFLLTRVLFSLAQAMLNSIPAHIGHCGPKPG